MENVTPGKKQIDTFDYKLADPINYADHGSTLQTDTVQLIAPGAKLYIKAFALSQAVNIATMKAITIFQTMSKAIAECKRSNLVKGISSASVNPTPPL